MIKQGSVHVSSESLSDTDVIAVLVLLARFFEQSIRLDEHASGVVNNLR